MTVEMEMGKPTLTYKGAFLVGGVAFAAVTYVLGTWLYQLEYQFVQGAPLALDYVATVKSLPVDHLVTFASLVAATTLLSVLLGYLFDRQVQYRRVAEQLQARAEMLAVVDGLTQVYNHAYFLEQFGLEIKRTTRSVGDIMLLMIDLDNFKQYNDTRGHLQGDELLKRVARTIRGIVRETDLVARYGGDEFVVVAQAAGEENGRLLGERIRHSIELTTPITSSIGVAICHKDGESVEELIEAADRLMYRAKQDGRNRVVTTTDYAHALPSVVDET